jgi:pyridoxal phosphate enzyme (YggS family)
MTIRDRLKNVLERMEKAAKKSGRSLNEITLVAVTKNFPSSVVREAYKLGLRNFGENRAQELKEKFEDLQDLPITWHFIGRIQTNKVKYFVPIASYVHSVWREEELKEIEKRASKIGKTIKVFIEVNISGEETKAGVRPDEIEPLLEKAMGMKHIQVIGLMTMAPFVENPEEVRWIFRKLREIRDEIAKKYPQVKELSMGMSNDFEVAIEEGATFVRIGTAIFGPRPQAR